MKERKTVLFYKVQVEHKRNEAEILVGKEVLRGKGKPPFTINPRFKTLDSRVKNNETPQRGYPGDLSVSIPYTYTYPRTSLNKL